MTYRCVFFYAGLGLIYIEPRVGVAERAGVVASGRPVGSQPNAGLATRGDILDPRILIPVGSGTAGAEDRAAVQNDPQRRQAASRIESKSLDLRGRHAEHERIRN